FKGGSEPAREASLDGHISLSAKKSATKTKTIFALFVHKSIIHCVRVPDYTVNKFAYASKGRCHPSWVRPWK
ncbi:MAG: hypothetical protein ABS999_23640, partial [Pseudomonas atacamensis]|uniref:hypothetical protein n=1 Tax=Pseudomonas atacamensis TaxID=2565368 RepID=UPI0033159B47